MSNTPPYLHSARPTAAEDPRLRAVIDWERRTRSHRPRVRDDVREAAYDKAVDALLKDDTLGRRADGRPSAAVTYGLAEQCLAWKTAEDLRRRFTPEGDLRAVPRAAQSLDNPLTTGGDGGTSSVADLVPAAGPPVEEIVHWRMQFKALARRATACGRLTQDAVSAYLAGRECDDVAARHGVGINAVHQVKRRFVAGNPGARSMIAGPAVEVRLTAHCIDQFRERFRPGLSTARANAELQAMMPCARVVEQPPSWLADRRRTPDAYLVLGDDLAMPLVHCPNTGHYTAVTCLARGSISPTERERRRATSRQERRQGRRR